MAFPTSPTDGQIYNGYRYDGTLGVWNKTNFIKSQLYSHSGDRGEGRSIEFLNNKKLQFGKTESNSNWAGYTQSFYDEISPFPSCITDGPRSAYFVKAGGNNDAPTTTSFDIYWQRDASGSGWLAAASNAHWLAIGG